MPDEDLLGVRFDVEDLAGELILLRRRRATARRRDRDITTAKRVISKL
jgi:hypothetical protein